MRCRIFMTRIIPAADVRVFINGRNIKCQSVTRYTYSIFHYFLLLLEYTLTPDWRREYERCLAGSNPGCVKNSPCMFQEGSHA